MSTFDAPILGDFPPELERLTNARAGDRNPLGSAGGGMSAGGARILFGELRALHEAVAWHLEREAEREQA